MLPATATLPAVAMLPATAALPAVAMLPATAMLPAVESRPTDVGSWRSTIEYWPDDPRWRNVVVDPATLTADLPDDAIERQLLRQSSG